VGPLPQIQILNDPFHGFVENLGGEPLALDGPPAEPVDRATVEIAQADAGRGHAVPPPSESLAQETTQSRTVEHPLRASGPVVELAPVADRIAVGCDDDLDVLSAGIRLQVDVNRDPEQRLRLVRDLLQQPKDPPDPDDFASFVLADLQDTAPRVGESADPLQVLVVLGALPQDVAGVRRHGWGRADRGE